MNTGPVALTRMAARVFGSVYTYRSERVDRKPPVSRHFTGELFDRLFDADFVTAAGRWEPRPAPPPIEEDLLFARPTTTVGTREGSR